MEADYGSSASFIFFDLEACVTTVTVPEPSQSTVALLRYDLYNFNYNLYFILIFYIIIAFQGLPL